MYKKAACDVFTSILARQWHAQNNTEYHFQWGETYNHVFGRTTNPYDRYMTSGGSSGGEAALLALRGSPLGVGTDIGGYVPCLLRTANREPLAPSAFEPSPSVLFSQTDSATAPSGSRVRFAASIPCARPTSASRTATPSTRRRARRASPPSSARWRTPSRASRSSRRRS